MNTVQFTINIKKQHFYLLILTLALLFGLLFVTAAITTKPNPGHSTDEVEGLATAFTDITTLKTSNTQLQTNIQQLQTPIDCKWIGAQGTVGAKATSVSIMCPTTHPVLISGSGSCYTTQSTCDVTGQKITQSKPFFGAPPILGGTYQNGWLITCDQPAKSSCALPEVYALCCTARVSNNLPTTTLPTQ